MTVIQSAPAFHTAARAPGTDTKYHNHPRSVAQEICMMFRTYKNSPSNNRLGVNRTFIHTSSNDRGLRSRLPSAGDNCLEANMLVSRLRVMIFPGCMLISLVGLTLLTCTNGSTSPHEQDVFVTVSSQPINLGDAKAAAQAYYDSGAYQRDLEEVAPRAASSISSRAPSANRPALVLDIDETALS